MKLAVLFPGIGYTKDKPLMYYAGKFFKERGYIIRVIDYVTGDFSAFEDVQERKMMLKTLMVQVEEQLSDYEDYEEIIFVSKSIGSVISEAFARGHQLTDVHNIIFTPIAETFIYIRENTLVFHGTADPLMNTDELIEKCEFYQIPYELIEHANHSLETGKVIKDLKIIRKVFKAIRQAYFPE